MTQQIHTTQKLLLHRTRFFAAGVSVLALCIGIFIPYTTHAATFQNGQVITVSTSTLDNAYYAAGEVSVNSPLPEDLAAVAGTITVSAPIGGDALLAGGTVDVQKPILGDARIVGGRVNMEDSVGGDLVVAGGFVTVNGKAKDTRIAGGTVTLTNGSNGPVTIYGSDVTISGEFNGNVEVVASDKITIGEGTIIHGVFKYNAPQQADIPASAHIDSGVDYIGSAAFLPTVQEAKTFAVAGLWVFIFVRLAAYLVAVGLIAGLFPRLTDNVVQKMVTRSPEQVILTSLLGLASFILIPMLVLLLLVSFVGIGIAIIIGVAYVLFLLLAYAYSAVLVGALFMKLVRRSQGWHISWRGALVGVVVLYLLGSIPILGLVIKIIMAAAAGGVLLSLAYHFAFRREEIHFMDL
jgi:hypothetical protein